MIMLLLLLLLLLLPRLLELLLPLPNRARLLGMATYVRTYRYVPRSHESTGHFGAERGG
jgi:hypothetical protein